MALAIFRNRDHTQICKSLQTETFEILDRYKIKDLLPTFHDLRRQNILYQHNSSSEKDQPLNILLTNFMIAERSEEKSIPIIHRWFLLRAGCPRNSPAIAHLLQHVRWSWQEVEINWSSPPFAILLWPLTSQYRAQENLAWPNRLGWCMWPWQRLTNGEQPPQQGCLEQPFFLRGGPKAKICRAGRGRDREKQHENSKFFCRLMRKEFLQMLILHQYAIVQLSHYLSPAYLCQYFNLAFISQVEQMYVQGEFTFIQTVREARDFLTRQPGVFYKNGCKPRNGKSKTFTDSYKN